jgi:hypothetical protein
LFGPLNAADGMLGDESILEAREVSFSLASIVTQPRLLQSFQERIDSQQYEQQNETFFEPKEDQFNPGSLSL